jgi:hypothetical protein
MKPSPLALLRRAPLCAVLVSSLFAQPAAPPAAPVSVNRAGAFPGYTLVAPTSSTVASLINLDGQVVHTWQIGVGAASSTYLLDNGNLLRTATLNAGAGGRGAGGGRSGGALGGAGAGGRILEIAWDGTVLWDYTFASATQRQHHDITRLPNGNILMLIWDAKTAEESIAAGRKPEYQSSGGELPPDGIIEVKPTGKNTGQIVWEWHVWDHLVQDADKAKPNYGDVAAQSGRIDINYSENWMDPPAAGAARGRGGRGVGGGGGGGRIMTTDWTHLNGIAYNAALDQIIVSSYAFSEFWIIDHSTTTAEAAGRTGGKSGQGGDLLYRWGNPAAHRAGGEADQTLFCPHNAQWIAPGLSGAGHVLIFNNGPNRPSGERYSSVDEWELPVDKDGRYARAANGAFAPPKLVWSYTAPNKTDFYATNISGAQRLPNGNTLICSGPNGRLFEVTAAKEIVWEYLVPAGGARGGAAGARGPAGAAGGRGAFAGGAGRGGGGGFGGGNQIFRAYRYGPDFPGLKGKEMTQLKAIEPAVRPAS